MLQIIPLRKLLGTISEPYLYWWARRFNGGLLFYACFHPDFLNDTPLATRFTWFMGFFKNKKRLTLCGSALIILKKMPGKINQQPFLLFLRQLQEL